MANLLPNLVNNLAVENHKVKRKYEHDNKKCKSSTTKYKDCYCIENSNVFVVKRIIKKSLMKTLKKVFYQYS